MKQTRNTYELQQNGTYKKWTGSFHAGIYIYNPANRTMIKKLNQ